MVLNISINRKFFIGAIAICAFVFISCSGNDSAPNNQTATPTQNSNVAPTNFISPNQARQFGGQLQTVCGNVVDTFYSTASNGKPTFLNFERPYPNATFTVVIWENNRVNFPSNPQFLYRNRYVCVRGLIEFFRGSPQIVPTHSNQIVYLR